MSPERISQIVDERIAKAFEAVPAMRIEVKSFDGELRPVSGHQHPKFKTLLRSMTARRANGLPLNVLLAGPAASGKSYAPVQAATSMGLDVHLVSKCEGVHDILGFIDGCNSPAELWGTVHDLVHSVTFDFSPKITRFI